MKHGELYSRILGSLSASCIGDALGAPTEERAIDEIRDRWGLPVQRFIVPPDDSPFASGRDAGQMTDDASQMMFLVDAYIEGDGKLTVEATADALVRWADTEYVRFAGPTTKAGIARLRAGDNPYLTGFPTQLAGGGTTNGAAMRVAPAGLAHPGDPEAAIQDALITCMPTHATNIAISGASCVAAAVATAMIPDVKIMDVVRAARWGAIEGDRLGRERGRVVAGPSIVRRLDVALEVASRAQTLEDAIVSVAGIVGTGLPMAEAVPAALAFFLAASGDPLLAVAAGASAGSDTDTVACIAGSIAGAFKGFESIPPDLFREVEAANELDLESKSEAFAGAVLGARLVR